MKAIPSSVVLPLRSLAAASLLLTAAGSSAAIASYYVGVDNLQNFTSGTYQGQANPNHGRLTFLYAHPNYNTPASSHYHSKGVYTLSGPAGSPTVITSSSNYLPEGANPPLQLTAGSGFYANKLVSNPYTDAANPGFHFSQLNIRDTADLSTSAPGTAEQFLFNSSAGRWNSPIAGADIHLTLVGLSEGLRIGDISALDIGLNAAGDEFHLGDDIDFTPAFWVDASAAPGTYTATFKLTDESGLFQESGNFEFRFTVVPEPSGTLLIAGAAALGIMRRRRH
ncbi:PEP-CTERM sorting domain-containing protein [Luteolibacter ambystomatis]|uniref:PEP-CTERM sorting domain-containing protein n=1 Tax=Luteolibacter ambystomatis TaxID=2824561 RepID=A0A975IXV1_9BACT|nr:all3515 family Zur-repressed PEP-CTERM protein [Luteolibacter ambystomatis]QUE49726.1 PEP-CTERM sorting domain-containing protein [Luteolibacter ambystomatis]